MATQAFGANCWLTINRRPVFFQKNDENEHLEVRENISCYIRITSALPHEIDEITITIDGVKLESERYGIWEWRPMHFAGLYELQASGREYLTQTANIRVFPQKLTQMQFEQMSSDLSKLCMDLLFCLTSPAYIKVELAQRRPDTSPLREYNQLILLIERLHSVIERIYREPHFTQQETTLQQSWHKVRTFDHRSTPVLGSALLGSGSQHMPANWRVTQLQPNYDVYENRLIKHFLHQVDEKIKIIQQHTNSEIKHRRKQQAIKLRNNWEDDETPEIAKLQEILQRCKELKTQCLQWCNLPFLHNVKTEILADKTTMVLQKHPFYAQFYKIYLQFQQQLKTSLNAEEYITTLGQRKVSELYEKWSVLEVTEHIIETLLDAGYDVESQHIFYTIEPNHFQVDIKKNTASIRLKKGETRVDFKYEPYYPNHVSVQKQSALFSATHNHAPLTPDMAVEIYVTNQDGKWVPRHLLIFDAKYRYSKLANGFKQPQEEDIGKMYHYREYIRYREYDSKREKYHTNNGIVYSAYVLYPGDDLRRELNGRIGCVPCVPRMSQSQVEDMKTLFHQLLQGVGLIKEVAGQP